MTDRPQCCGECAHWTQRELYDESEFGACMVEVSLPASAVTPFERQVMLPIEGDKCLLFKRREQSDDQSA